MAKITYKELADRLDAMFLFNKAPELDTEIFEGLENGDLFTNPEPCDWFLNDGRPVREWCCNTHMYAGGDNGVEGEDHPEQCDFAEQTPDEIYQWYLISPSDADYLKRHTQELVFYSEVLDEYVWGVTHFGTPWEGVSLDFVEAE